MKGSFGGDGGSLSLLDLPRLMLRSRIKIGGKKRNKLNANV